MSENPPELPSLATSHEDKRIVFQHAQGPHMGLIQIMGLTSELGITADEPLPSSAEGFEALGRVIEFASLVTVNARYALYRELMPFGGLQKDFDSRQQ